MSGFVHIKPVAANRILPPETLEVKLTEVESQVCALLDECTQQMKDEKGLSTSCRVAGGWVRDKVNFRHPADRFWVIMFIYRLSLYLTVTRLSKQ
jgi:hypothetical protein